MNSAVTIGSNLFCPLAMRNSSMHQLLECHSFVTLSTTGPSRPRGLCSVKLVKPGSNERQSSVLDFNTPYSAPYLSV
jgi:hypothetical protein